MTVLKKYNSGTSQWEPIVSGATGPTGPTGAASTVAGPTGPTGPTGTTGAGYLVTSITSLLIGTGSKTLTTNTANHAYIAGDYINIVSTANSANYMRGTVTSISSTTLVFTCDAIGGSGTIASWNISLMGQTGATGFSAVTVSSATPSGGTDGDFWVVYS